MEPSGLPQKTRHCPVCGAECPHEVVFEKWGYPIVRCQGCGVGATHVEAGFNPAAIYQQEYFDGRRVDGYAAYVQSEKVLRAEFRRTVQHLLQYTPAGGRLLEVGCAYGFFLAEAARHFQCVGVELCEHAARSCRQRGLEVHHGTCTRDLLQELGTFDVVVLLDVIEHLAEPDQLLALLAQALKPGGVLLLTTGDWDSPLSRLLGPRWRLMTPPQHLYFFSRKTLTRLLARMGLEVAECKRPWKVVPVGLAAYQLTSRLGWPVPVPFGNWLGLPINLFDTVRLVARNAPDRHTAGPAVRLDAAALTLEAAPQGSAFRAPPS